MNTFFSIKGVNFKSQPSELGMSFVLFYINNRTNIQNQESKKRNKFQTITVYVEAYFITK